MCKSKDIHAGVLDTLQVVLVLKKPPTNNVRRATDSLSDPSAHLQCTLPTIQQPGQPAKALRLHVARWMLTSAESLIPLACGQNIAVYPEIIWNIWSIIARWVRLRSLWFPEILWHFEFSSYTFILKLPCLPLVCSVWGHSSCLVLGRGRPPLRNDAQPFPS